MGVGVGWQRRWKLCQALRELDNHGIDCFFFGGHDDGYRVRSYCAGWRTLTPHKGNDGITYSEYSKAPTRQLHSNTQCCLWSGHTREQSNSLALVIHKQDNRHKVPKSVLRAVLGRMQFTLHATRRTIHAASRLLGASNACLVGENPTCSVPA